ncbi:hypothetical protein D3C76_1703130 [compost metagenome]
MVEQALNIHELYADLLAFNFLWRIFSRLDHRICNYENPDAVKLAKDSFHLSDERVYVVGFIQLAG